MVGHRVYLILMSLAVWDFLSTPCCCGCRNPSLGRAPHSELAALPSREGWEQSLQLSPHNRSPIISNHMEDSVCNQRVQSHKDQCWKELPSSFLSYTDALLYRTFCLLAPCPPGTLWCGENHTFPRLNFHRSLQKTFTVHWCFRHWSAYRSPYRTPRD